MSGRDALLRAVIEHVADHGIGNQSLRGLAEAIGTSHRMLIYHFGSREGLLTEIVAAMEEQQRAVLAQLSTAAAEDQDIRTVLEQFWTYLTGEARRFGPIFFELSAYAMQGHPHAERMRATLVEPWMGPLTELFVRAGFTPEQARVRVRLGLAAARGLHQDALVTGDVDEVNAAVDLFRDLVLELPAGQDRPR